MNKDYFDWRFGITSYYQFAIKAPWSGICILVGQWQTVYEEWLNGLQTDYWVVDALGIVIHSLLCVYIRMPVVAGCLL